MQTDAKSKIQEALSSVEKSDEKDIAAYIKKKLDEDYGPTVSDCWRAQPARLWHSASAQWHCIVGSDFKAQFTHEKRSFLFVQAGKTNVLLFKT